MEGRSATECRAGEGDARAVRERAGRTEGAAGVGQGRASGGTTILPGVWQGCNADPGGKDPGADRARGP